MKHSIKALALALSIAPLFAGPVAAQSALKIGIVTALSGPFAAPGKFQMNGFNMAIDDLNKNGGTDIGGKKYKAELVVYDTRCNAAEGSSSIQRLATVDEVPVVLGELCTPVALAEAPIANENELPFINTVAGSPSITDLKLPYVFRVNANQDQTTNALLTYVVENNTQPLGFLAWNNDAGRAGVRLMKDLLPKTFSTPYVGFFNNGDVDFRSQITAIREAGVKAVMLMMDEEPGSLAIRQIRENGLDVQLIGTLAMGSNRFLQRLDAKTLNGMVQYNTFPPNSDTPRIKAFSTRYTELYHEEAHGWAANSYDGIMVAVEAMKRAGTVTDRKKIRDEIAKTDADGIAGHIKFRPDGQADAPVYVTKWCADGTRSVVFPPEAVAACGKG